MDTPRPNVLLILTDDQRFDALGRFSGGVVRTPRLDALIAGGTCFTHAHIPGGTCAAVCMPSRAMLHTGRSLFHLDGCGQSIPREHALLGEMFREAGYAAFGTGKWHNGPAAFNRAFEDGDEIFFGGMADHWNVPAFHYDPSGAYAGRLPVIRDPFGGNAVEERMCDHIHAGVHSTDLLSQCAADRIRRHDFSRPLFLYTAFLAPHDPRSMPRAFRELYDPDRIPLPPNFMGGHPFDIGDDLRVRDERLAAFPRDPAEVRRHLAEYYGMISHLDARIGDILDALETRGQRGNTVVVVAGDNGLALGQHGLMGKQNLYDHSVRVPLIFAGPGVPRGRLCDARVFLSDLFATLGDLIGAPVPASVECPGFAAVLRGEAEEHRESLYLAYRMFIRGVRRGRFKLIESVAKGRRTGTQLFDTDADPFERNNLVEAPEHALLLEDLRRELFRLRDTSGDLETTWGRAFWSDGLGWDAAAGVEPPGFPG